MTPLNVQGPALPALLGISTNTVQARLRADAPLVRSGLVSVDILMSPPATAPEGARGLRRPARSERHRTGWPNGLDDVLLDEGAPGMALDDLDRRCPGKPVAR